MAMVNGYWRNGPVLNNAICGVDMALWDIKGKLADMPFYDLLGGKCRHAAAVYVHGGGPDPEEVVDNVRADGPGLPHIRCQLGGYGGQGPVPGQPGCPGAPAQPAGVTPAALKMSSTCAASSATRWNCSTTSTSACRPSTPCASPRTGALPPLLPGGPAWPPRTSAGSSDMRQQCATPLAMGELFNSPHEWTSADRGRLIDYIRVHISQMGGLTPARAVAHLANIFGVRTAWHGPGDVSPVGHAANVHLDAGAELRHPGVVRLQRARTRCSPAAPRCTTATCTSTTTPASASISTRDLAAKYPVQDTVERWTQTRWPDGSPARP